MTHRTTPMTVISASPLHRLAGRVGAVLLALGLAACSSSPKPKPQSLEQVPVAAAVTAWETRLGADLNRQLPTVRQGQMALTTQAGEVAVVDLSSGQALWRHATRARLVSGAGFDGVRVAVVSDTNQLIVMQAGQQVWQVRLPSQSFTPPLIAGGRVFVLLADRTVLALDGDNGGLIWDLQLEGEPLVLQQPGVLTHVGNRLLVGLGSRLVKLNPDNGQVEWQTTLAVPRGYNDLERLIDLIAPFELNGSRLCAVSFQTQISCVNTGPGHLLWSRSSTSVVGLSGDDKGLANVQENGVVRYWNVTNGQMLWDSERLKFRQLHSPLIRGERIWLADEDGQLFGLQRSNGELNARLNPGLGALAADPINTEAGVLLVSRKGQIRLLKGL